MAELRTRSSERLTPKITLVLQPNHHSDHNANAFGHWNLSREPMQQGPGELSPVWTSGSGTHAPNAAAWRSALDSTGQSPWGFPSGSDGAEIAGSNGRRSHCGKHVGVSAVDSGQDVDHREIWRECRRARRMSPLRSSHSLGL